jgi:hypothetical protein
MKLSIIIVSYNTQKYTLDCLTSVYKAIQFGKFGKITEVIVVDNGSNDQTVPEIRRRFPKVILFANRKNKGFAAANNQGMKCCHGEYILLLNSDTTFTPDTLSTALMRIKSNPKVGVLGCKLLWANGSLQPSFGYLPRLSRVAAWMLFIDDLPIIRSVLKPYHAVHPGFYTRERDVGWVTGAFFLLRSFVLSKVGFLDEKVFMYGEEVEWCYRIDKAGLKVYFTPHITVIHHKGASSIGSDAGIVEEYKALLYLFEKHKPSWELTILRVLLGCGALLRIVLFGIIGRYEKRIPYYKKALLVAWG